MLGTARLIRRSKKFTNHFELMINLHLFSTPGDDLRDVVETAFPYLEGKKDPRVAYLPLASLYAGKWHEANRFAFKGLAQLAEINAELMTQKEIENIIRDSELVYITGGNTFLLNHRLYSSGIMPYLRRKIQNGLPLVGVNAGMIVCGPNVLSSSDMNTVETKHFEGLNLSPFNFLAHYAPAEPERVLQDDWLSDYHFFHDNSVIMSSDSAYVAINGKKTTLVRGEAWILRKDSEKEKLEVGGTIVP